MTLSVELQKLPPQALDVIRFLKDYEHGVEVDAILSGTGLSERAFGKAIRRLVTRYYVNMPSQNTYVLTSMGRDAAEEIQTFDGAAPATVTRPAAVSDEEAPAAAAAQVPQVSETPIICHPRRLSVLVAQEFVMGMKSMLLVGFDSPTPDVPPMEAPGQIVLRLSAPGCNIDPVERPIEVAVDRACGPVQFRVQPRLEGLLRIKIEAAQFINDFDTVPIGGIFFDLDVVPFPTSRSAEFRALGAVVELIANVDNIGPRGNTGDDTSGDFDE